MIAEHQVEYWGAILGILTPVYLVMNWLVGGRIRSALSNRSLAARTRAVHGIVGLLRDAAEARRESAQLQLGLSYAMTRTMKGWAGFNCGLLLYLSGLAVFLWQVTIQNRAWMATGLNAPAIAGSAVMLFAAGIWFGSKGQSDLRQGLRLRDALAARSRFLNEATQRLQQATAAGGVADPLLLAAQMEIQAARGATGVDWLAHV